MVRRLKKDLRKISGGFPRQRVVQVDTSDLPPRRAGATDRRHARRYRGLGE
jgi:hypothetical protein